MSDSTDFTSNSGDAPNPDVNNSDDLPTWVRERMTKANNEAAKYRTELRKKTEEHTAALEQINALTGEKDALTDRSSAAEKELLKLRVAVKSGVPGESADEFAALLQGDTEEDIAEHAKKVISLFGASNQPPAATDRSQGRGDQEQIPATPQAALAAVLQSQLSSFNH